MLPDDRVLNEELDKGIVEVVKMAYETAKNTSPKVGSELALALVDVWWPVTTDRKELLDETLKSVLLGYAYAAIEVSNGTPEGMSHPIVETTMLYACLQAPQELDALDGLMRPRMAFATQAGRYVGRTGNMTMPQVVASARALAH